ncbi:AAA family ATPase [Paenibacillus sp. MMS20-IR301]|uniref:AAA family ATPase n=1 Tax=Paenibacillus sp. MMS20-IR301 TaxID=2895946 RepID=UPI0028E8B55B|nr:AAA family ATPase [Paenibacillus sp. MMS20-IR301]WNS45351.1 AAA family ATPase [Paenibacillus sp. MMS20-IR301]
MQPQLLFVHISDIGRLFKEQSFVLTNDFIIKLEQQRLFIERKENPYVNLWGSHISNINLIVGKNGAGKTTLLELLGSTKLRRSRLFDDPQWFALYHLEEDLFLIEGAPKLLLRELNAPSELLADTSICVKYDFRTHMMQWKSVQDTTYKAADGQEYPVSEALISLFQTKESDRLWLKSLNILDGQDNTDSFKRHYLHKPALSSTYRFMSNEYIFLEGLFTFNQAVFQISQHAGIDSDINDVNDMYSILGFSLYQDKHKMLYFTKTENDNNTKQPSRSASKWSIKELFILSYLEALIIDLANRATKYPTSHNDVHPGDLIGVETMEENTYEARKVYLFKVLNILKKTSISKIEKYEAIEFDVNIFAAILIALEEIDASLFKSRTTIRVPVQEGMHESIYGFLDLYDRFYNSYGVSYSLDVSYKYLSSGEIEFIRAFSCINDMVQVSLKDERINSVLLIMDEPDVSFHPEWSRKYIYYLKKFIEHVNSSKEIKYQILLSTHSPFIVSDIPKEHITCINVIEKDDELQRVVNEAEFGLMSNFYDIVKNDFFLGSPIGEFAHNLFKDLVKQMNGWPEYNPVEIRKVSMIISGIGEPVIRGKLQSHLEAQAIRLQESNTQKEDRRIRELEMELEQLKKKRGEKHGD